MKKKDVSNLQQKAVITFKNPPPICFNPEACSCVYCDHTTGEFSVEGVDTEVDIDNGVVKCPTSHLSEFNLYSNNATLLGVDAEDGDIVINGEDDGTLGLCF